MKTAVSGDLLANDNRGPHIPLHIVFIKERMASLDRWIQVPPCMHQQNAVCLHRRCAGFPFHKGLGKKGDEWAMPNIKPISDLRNYSEVLHEVKDI